MDDEHWDFNYTDIKEMIDNYSKITQEELRDHIYDFIEECLQKSLGKYINDSEFFELYELLNKE